ncbi:unnamed protein product [Rhodiola kirilowii]
MEVKRRVAEALVSKLSSVSDQTRTDALCELRLMTKNDAESRPIIAEAGAIPYLTDIIYSPSPIQQENACAMLLNLSISVRQSLISTHGLLDALSHALNHPASPAAFDSAAAALFSLLSVDDYRSVIGSKRDIIYALVKSIGDRSTPPRSVKDALRALFGISLHPPNRKAVVELGAVPVLFSLVMKDGRVGIVEDATAVIAQVAGCEASIQAFGKASGIRVLADLLDSATGSSERTKENAVAAFLNLVQHSGGVEEVKYAMGFGVLDGIEEVVEHGTEKGKLKALALLKAIDHQSRYSSASRFDSSLQQNQLSV